MLIILFIIIHGAGKWVSINQGGKIERNGKAQSF